MYQSRYNVFDAAGQVKYGSGDAIDEAEAVRQGIVELPQGQQLVFTGATAVLQPAPVMDAPDGDTDASTAAPAA